MPLTRPLLAAAALVALGATGLAGTLPAQAAPRAARKAPAPTTVVTDPVGDALALGPGWDLVKVTMVTKGKVAGRSYRPTDLVVTLTMAGPPTTQRGAAITVNMNTTGCSNGSFSFSYTPGATLGGGSLFVTGCGTTTPGSSGLSEILKDVAPVVSGNDISWDLPLADVGRDLPVGSVFSGFTAYSDVSDPVTGLLGTSLAGGAASIDSAAGSGSYRLS